jgi:hypothetical protein
LLHRSGGKQQRFSVAVEGFLGLIRIWFSAAFLSPIQRMPCEAPFLFLYKTRALMG